MKYPFLPRSENYKNKSGLNPLRRRRRGCRLAGPVDLCPHALLLFARDYQFRFAFLFPIPLFPIPKTRDLFARTGFYAVRSNHGARPLADNI